MTNDRMLEIAAGMMEFFIEADYKALADSEKAQFALVKYRRLLALSEAGLEVPIQYTRFAPEVVALSWFFGMPSFGRDQNMERIRRAPKGEKADPAAVQELKKQMMEILTKKDNGTQ